MCPPTVKRARPRHGLQRIRLLYLYPSEVHDPLVSTMLELPTVVPYFDLSLQHAAPGLLRRMKRWGSGERFRTMIEGIREPAVAGGLTTADHFDAGIRDLLRTAEPDGVFCYTFFKATGGA